ncbi:PREDICTED: 50S ribosomal protein L21, mitochondrial [Fragaria vesca subsp. vesca]|uniref:50S ribosomal protein L21, mitochondrial n=1 Tax=Fragaria vesca subsp. vesca TaxID=101020 RepID=UPI0002C31AF9|nr:PREDICTED: 50S ribosomal protein L21, mitochondrial [Fragaria vesca subsp. vesca]
MANRRCLQLLTRRVSALFSANPPLHTLSTPPPLSTHEPLKALVSKSPLIFSPNWSAPTRHFSSDRNDGVDDSEDDDDDDDEDDDIGYSSDDGSLSKGGGSKREYTPEEMAAEAAGIGYKVVGPLETTDGVFKPYEPVFAVIQIGSHQFKVSNGDSIFTERLKFCEVNDKLILNKVLLVGTSSQTMIGRPIVPDATVHAVVEEHALDAKVLIFKKKRRKNYRRTKGHRQELTKLRIIDIQGIQKPEPVVTEKPSKTHGKKPEKVAVAA